MNTVDKFEDLKIWQRARRLCKDVYEVMCRPPFSRDYPLRDQVNKSSGSIMDNIAEGFERDGNKEFVNFLSIAKSSAGELKSQLYRAADRNYITDSELAAFKSDIELLMGSIGALMKYLRSCDMKGNKFRREM